MLDFKKYFIIKNMMPHFFSNFFNITPITNFETWIIDHEAHIRGLTFFTLLILFFVLEHLFTLKKSSAKINHPQRWKNNLGLVLFNTMILRFITPLLPVTVSLWKQNHLPSGIFQIIDWPLWVEITIFVILMDLIIYWQHRLFHTIPFFWRFHQVHHLDPHLDTTSGNRFHPIEILISLFIKLFFIVLISPHPVAVIIFETILNGMSLFNHSSLRISPSLDLILRLFLVSPGMHHVHHSSTNQEWNRNFGFNLSWWDKVFKSYQKYPQEGYENYRIGLPGRKNLQDLNFFQLLIYPFKEK